MRAEVLQEIAAMLDHPNVYMGGPSQRNMRRAEQIYAAVAPLIAAAERERCARLAEDRHLGWVFPHPDDARPGEVCDDATACADIAAAIRALD